MLSVALDFLYEIDRTKFSFNDEVFLIGEVACVAYKYVENENRNALIIVLYEM